MDALLLYPAGPRAQLAIAPIGKIRIFSFRLKALDVFLKDLSKSLPHGAPQTNLLGKLRRLDGFAGDSWNVRVLSEAI